MKKLMMFMLGAVAVVTASAQTTAENEIRVLEKQEVQAILAKDTATLRKLWSADLMTNSSSNRVNIGRQIDFVKNGVMDYSNYNRTIEQVRTEGNIVITMGNEMVIPASATDPTKSITRRVTSVWMNQQGSWRLIARQTSELCK